MPLDKFIAKQLRQPSGLFSHFGIRFMNRTNLNLNKLTVQLLDVQPSDRILEIGFGGGGAIQCMIDSIQDGLIAGLDISDAALARCHKTFKKSVSQNKLELKKGYSTNIPYQNDFFNKVFAVNCIYFWSDPAVDLKEIYRVLKTGGTMILAIRPKEELSRHAFTKHGFSLYSDKQMQELLEQAGFTGIRIEHREDPPHNATFAIGVKN
jgi:ubiquinone/menaquinone biosynthesis C-methylase UbiE